LRTLRSVPASAVVDGLQRVISAAGAPVIIHCCAPDAPIDLFRQADAVGVSVDVSLVDNAGLDRLGELIDAGNAFFAGVVPSTGDRPASATAAATVLTTLWSKLGFPAAELTERVVLTPACGLAGATPAYARSALTACVEAAKRLADRQ
jgi:methionine synthase II (cobalamin-independent)